MQADAASYLDDDYKHNQAILERAAKRVGRSIVLLTIEILALTATLPVTPLAEMSDTSSPKALPSNPMPSTPPPSVVAVEIRGATKPR